MTNLPLKKKKMMNMPDDDAVMEILLRLPVRSLLRFRCVCKNWCVQIDSSLFKEKHLAYRLSRYDDELIVVNRKYHIYSYDYYDSKNVVTYYGDYQSLSCWKSSCNFDIGSHWSSFSTRINGIVCITLLWVGFNIFLCNPALREFRKLSEFKDLPGGFGLTYPIRRRAVGFGFDDVTEDYIVVQILSLKKKDDDRDGACTDHKSVIYRVRTDSWMMDEMPAFVSASYFKDNNNLFYSSFFSHGSIHWCMGREPSYRILTFNTTRKLFQEIRFPHGWKDYKYKEDPHLFKVDNSSCIALVGAHAHDLHTLDVWVMKEYGVTESWTKQYSISCLPWSIQKPLSFWRKDKLLLATTDGKIIWYDLSTGQLYEPPGQCDPMRPDVGTVEVEVEVVTCCESLVSIKKS